MCRKTGIKAKANSPRQKIDADQKRNARGISPRTKKILFSSSLSLLLIGIIIAVVQYVFIPNRQYVPPAVVIMPTATPRMTAAITVSSAAVTPTPFVKVPPVKMYFTARNIFCDVQPVGKTAGGAMATIDDPYIAAWYQDGPSPGDKGNALVNGHVRWGGIAGTFSILSEMDIGEQVVFEYENGTQKSFYVTDKLFYPFDGVPAQLMSQSGDDRVTLISCYGKWDSDAGTSSQRVFVICKSQKPDP